jgi:hypothetical protein
LGTELYRTIRTEWLCARALAENVDLLVWISKRRIAAPASAAVLLTECPCGGSSQRDCGHCKQGNHCEPKLRRSKHRFPHTAARPQTPNVHSFAWALFCGGKAFSSEPINFVEERGAPATVGLMLLVRQGVPMPLPPEAGGSRRCLCPSCLRLAAHVLIGARVDSVS